RVTLVPGGPDDGVIEIVTAARAGSASQRTDPTSRQVEVSANPARIIRPALPTCLPLSPVVSLYGEV
ncbi:MAG TPA: hypothetical protein VJ858_07250, partial [Acidimicrobiia bacterium]|nr:hypothetical protein [Acidimicrobiia bacterium]